LSGNQLVVTGTDLDITARTTVDVIGIEDGSSVVPARLIVDAVRSLEAGAVTVSSGEDNVEISLGSREVLPENLPRQRLPEAAAR
jgi:DNA polymerase III sliding clamp (beta) subunit (PCNA family)